MTALVPSDVLLRLRTAVETAGGRNVMVARGDIAALLDVIAPDQTGPATPRPDGRVVLTEAPADVERLARAAWDTATNPDLPGLYGAWGSNTTEHAAHHRDAARRTIAHLLRTGREG